MTPPAMLLHMLGCCRGCGAGDVTDRDGEGDDGLAGAE